MVDGVGALDAVRGLPIVRESRSCVVDEDVDLDAVGRQFRSPVTVCPPAESARISAPGAGRAAARRAARLLGEATGATGTTETGEPAEGAQLNSRGRIRREENCLSRATAVKIQPPDRNA
jgi:hypothetical protein